jgi:hypothetical protein
MSDIATIFATDPLNLSKQDIEEVIKEFRSSADRFSAGNMMAGRTKEVKPKDEEAQKVLGKVSLKGLGL